MGIEPIAPLAREGPLDLKSRPVTRPVSLPPQIIYASAGTRQQKLLCEQLLLTGYRQVLDASAKMTPVAMVDVDAKTGAGKGPPSAPETEAERRSCDVGGEEKAAEAAFGKADVGHELEEPSACGGEDAGFANHAAELDVDVVAAGEDRQAEGGDQTAVFADADVKPGGGAVDDEGLGVVGGDEGFVGHEGDIGKLGECGPVLQGVFGKRLLDAGDG